MKAALVIDMPECCVGDCIFWEDRVCDACYAKEHKPIFDDDFGNDEDDFNKRPDWCPLRPLPEKRLYNAPYVEPEYIEGWNACLDAIGGEHDEAKTD